MRMVPLPVLALGILLSTGPALAQVGPFPAVGEQPASPLPREDQQREERSRARARADASSSAVAVARGQAPAGKLSACLSTIDANADGAQDAARAWLTDAKGAERVDAAQCLGSAQVALAQFDDARGSFIAARDAAAPGDHGSRARLGAMAGNAALAGGDGAGALAALDTARADADKTDKALTGGIAIDRARALVALNRLDEASAALAEARTLNPSDAEGWLLSATLSRRANRLADAQAQIERAAALAPVDPQVGVEAGVIAMLAGHPEAARKSWRSVVAAAPQSPSADIARGYLAQLGVDARSDSPVNPDQIPAKDASR